MKDFDSEILSAYVRGVLNQYSCVPEMERIQEICAEHGFSNVDQSFCDGFCPECGQIFMCEAYDEINDEWDGFYAQD